MGLGLLKKINSALRNGADAPKEYEFEIWQRGIVVACGSGTSLDDVRREMLHYAMQYVQDGPIKITGSKELALESTINP